MTMITPSYLGETIEYSSLHACRSTLEDPTRDLNAVHAVDPLCGSADVDVGLDGVSECVQGRDGERLSRWPRPRRGGRRPARCRCSRGVPGNRRASLGTCRRRGRCSGRAAPFVSIMKATDLRDCHDGAIAGRHDQTRNRRVFVQRKVRSGPFVARTVAGQQRRNRCRCRERPTIYRTTSVRRKETGRVLRAAARFSHEPVLRCRCGDIGVAVSVRGIFMPTWRPGAAAPDGWSDTSIQSRHAGE